MERTRPLSIGSIAIVLFAVASLDASKESWASEGYLPRVGPSELRFTVPPIKKLVLPPLPGDGEATTNGVNTDILATITATNPATMTPFEPVQDADIFEDLLKATDSELTSSQGTTPEPGTPGDASAASNLLIITPELLAEYLRPGRAAYPAATNAIAQTLLFNPPAPKSRVKGGTAPGK